MRTGRCCSTTSSICLIQSAILTCLPAVRRVPVLWLDLFRGGEWDQAAHDRVPAAIAEDSPGHRGKACLGTDLVAGLRTRGGDRPEDHRGHVGGVEHAGGAVAVRPGGHL